MAAVGNIYVANYGNSAETTYNAAETLVTAFTVNNPIGCCLRGIAVHYSAEYEKEVLFRNHADLCPFETAIDEVATSFVASF